MGSTRLKKVLYFIYCAIFFITVSIPAVITPFAPGGADRDSGAGSDFSKRFGLRDHFIALDAWLRAALFNESSNNKIILGKSDWLFLSETLDWGTAANRPLEITAARIARILRLEQEYANKNGAELIFMPVPNKARVYSDYLPYYNSWPGGDRRVLLDLVQERLRALGVRSIDLADYFALLRAGAPDAPYYHRLDSHWNNIGALEAYRTLMAEIDNILISNRGDGSIDTKPTFVYDRYAGQVPRVEADWPGDLDRMLNPLSDRLDEQFYYDIPNEYRSRKPIINPEEMNIESTMDKNDMRVLFFRDSFANALLQFFSNNLGKVTYSRAMPFQLERAENGAYDIVVAEIIERNLAWIADEAPDIPAPLRLGLASGGDGTGLGGTEETMRQSWIGASPLPAGSVAAAYQEAEQEAVMQSAAKITGCFDPSFLALGRELRIYPAFESDKGGLFIFEAFPITAPEMRETAESNWPNASAPAPDILDNGFSFQAGDLELPDGDYIIKILLVAYDMKDGDNAVWSGLSEPLLNYVK